MDNSNLPRDLEWLILSSIPTLPSKPCKSGSSTQKSGSYITFINWDAWWNQISNIHNGHGSDATFHEDTKQIVEWIGLVAVKSHLVEPYITKDAFIAVGKHEGPIVKIYRTVGVFEQPKEILQDGEWIIWIHKNNIKLHKCALMVEILANGGQLVVQMKSI
jgi:hypothetical protein